MQAIRTFAAFKKDVAEWLDREDLDSQIETFALLAQERINKTLRLPDMIETATIEESTDISIPDQYLQANEVFDAAFDDVYRTDLKDVRRNYGKLFARVGSKLFFTDRVQFPVTFIYTKQLPRVQFGQTCGYLLENAYSALLYGTLNEAAHFLDDPELVSKFGTRFEAALLAESDSAIADEYSGSFLEITRG